MTSSITVQHPASVDAYIRHQWSLVPIPPGSKGPRTVGWNRREAALRSQADLPPVLADRNQLKQVFFNLITNAMEAMGPGGKLKIKSRADDDSVYLMFGDSGVGIRQEDLAQLFQPYHSTKPGGHGLGLMIVQRIVRAHNGRIELESQVGRGTTFRVWLPLHERKPRLLEAPLHD